MRLELKDCCLPSGNKFMRDYSRRAGYKKLKPIIDAWGYRILDELLRTRQDYVGNTTRFQVRVVVNITAFVESQDKIKDDGNLIFAADKLIIDYLKKKRFFIDDTPRWVRWGKIEQLVGLPERVIVEIVEDE